MFCKKRFFFLSIYAPITVKLKLLLFTNIHKFITETAVVSQSYSFKNHIVNLKNIRFFFKKYNFPVFVHAIYFIISHCVSHS